MATRADAQGPGRLPAQTFNPVFDTNVGHTSQLQEVTLTGSTVVLEYDAATYTVQWPDHRNHQRAFWLKNTGSVAVGPVYYRVRTQAGTDSVSATLHGGLAPGERVQISYLFAWNRIVPAPGTCDECFSQIAGTELAQSWSITAFLCNFIGPDGNCQDASPPIASAPQSWILRAQSVAQRPKSGTVHGRVIDAVTGRDIANAAVEVVNPSGEIRLAPFNVHMALTGQGLPAGNYTIATVAMTALIRCTAPGYQTQHRVVEVAAGQSVTADFSMGAMPWTASFTLKSTIDAIGMWGWAQTPDGLQVVVTPALDFAIDTTNAYAWLMNVTDGTLAWKHFLGGQSAGPSISPDGTRVALPVQEGSGGPGTAALRILNRTDGSLLFTRAMPSAFNPMSTAYSPDGTRIVVGGSGGQLWLLDTTTYSTIWMIQLQAQTRAVAWSPDSQTIYATSDPSPVYAVNRGDGSVKWRSYNTSFAYQDNISQTADGSRIAIQAKYGGFQILDDHGNDIFREGARDGGGSAALASPDGSFFFGSAGQFNGSHIVDPTGRLYWWSRNTSEGVALTADNKFLLIGTSLNEIGGTELWTNTATEARDPHVAIITPDKRHILVAGGQGIDVFEGQICMPTVSAGAAFVGSTGGGVTSSPRHSSARSAAVSAGTGSVSS